MILEWILVNMNNQRMNIIWRNNMNQMISMTITYIESNSFVDESILILLILIHLLKLLFKE